MVAQDFKNILVEQIQCRISEQMFCRHSKTNFQDVERS
jgi:hypothetical protein